MPNADSERGEMTNTLKVSEPRDVELIVEKDVKIPMRDGAMLYADVLRPSVGAERVPAIMNIGPYQKDRLWIPPEDLEEKANPYLAWETRSEERRVGKECRCWGWPDQ